MLAFFNNASISKGAFPAEVVGAYAVFAFSALVVYHLIADGAISSTLTMSAMVHCLGAIFLCMQVLTTGTAAGISAKSLMLDAIAICFRLSSTLQAEGYLPVDKSGDHLFQLADCCSLGITMWLLHRVLVVQRSTYQASEDTFRVTPMVLVSLMLAIILHPDMDDNPFLDTLWMTGLFTAVVAVMPQLWLIMKTGGHAEALTSHYIAALALSRVLSGIFMWAAREDITCSMWIEGVNHGIWAIFAAHLIHLFLLGDFAYYYVRALLQKGVSAPMELSGAHWV
jgi:hypothetical protein